MGHVHTYVSHMMSLATNMQQRALYTYLTYITEQILLHIPNVAHTVSMLHEHVDPAFLHTYTICMCHLLLPNMCQTQSAHHTGCTCQIFDINIWGMYDICDWGMCIKILLYNGIDTPINTQMTMVTAIGWIHQVQFAKKYRRKWAAEW